MNKVNLTGPVPKGFKIGKATLQSSVIASITTLTTVNFTELENLNNAAVESDSSILNLKPPASDEFDPEDELPCLMLIWMQNLGITPVDGNIMEIKSS